MIERYTREEMGALWTEQSRYLSWLSVEFAVCEALAEDGVIPPKEWTKLKSALKGLEKRGGVAPERVLEIEKVTRHDIIAFSTAVAEQIGPSARYFHYGLTSSDVVDTALSLLIQKAGSTLLRGLSQLIKVCAVRAREFKNVATIGRSHGIFAEPTSFGLKFLGWAQELKRSQKRLIEALEQLRVGKLSGAVGVSPHWAPAFESRVLKKLGLVREPVATQVLPRDRHAALFQAMALTGTALERMAVELRHLQRSEVAEVREGFAKGQKGSSAMPHKRNPISSENITGCARLLRAYSQAALENVSLWHERDISHSSVERVALPDASILLDYAIHRMKGVVESLEVDIKQVEANLNRAGQSVYSGHVLLELIRNGVTRENAYAWVQECALAAIDEKGSFAAILTSHSDIKKYIPKGKIHELCSIQHQLRHVDAIYRSCEKDEEK